MENWKVELKDRLPLLGHRNWIVVTDMAYPLQSNPGIQTIYTDDSFSNVVSYVYGIIKEQSHIKPLVRQDKEFLFVEEEMASGIDAIRKEVDALFGGEVAYIPHETLISKLDEASKVFNVVILKTTLTIPYTSVFFELDCQYWTAEKEKALQNKM